MAGEDWAENKAKEMVSAGSSEWMYCNKCSDLTQFDGDKCMKCGTVKK
ncbi:MAG: hypothetical protein J4F28_07250 [Nitrosopumilaceae archaeon]|nr:hypothetical protein [Nitrosopumilaceae archaeon]